MDADAMSLPKATSKMEFSNSEKSLEQSLKLPFSIPELKNSSLRSVDSEILEFADNQFSVEYTEEARTDFVEYITQVLGY